MHTWHKSEVPCWQHTIALFSTLMGTLSHGVLLHIQCCLERHTSTLLHQCDSSILSPHYALTAPDCRLKAGRPLSVCSESAPLPLPDFSKHQKQTVSHSRWLWVLTVEQTVLTRHRMLRCLMSVHPVSSVRTGERMFVCDMDGMDLTLVKWCLQDGLLCLE